jgi:hypothetical protein
MLPTASYRKPKPTKVKEVASQWVNASDFPYLMEKWPVKDLEGPDGSLNLVPTFAQVGHESYHKVEDSGTIPPRPGADPINPRYVY